jgi:hypothetical protein
MDPGGADDLTDFGGGAEPTAWYGHGLAGGGSGTGGHTATRLCALNGSARGEAAGSEFIRIAAGLYCSHESTIPGSSFGRR